MIALPISTRQIRHWMPHRPPMVWIDQVLSVNNDGGVCGVQVSSHSPYVSPCGKVNESTVIEWIAQSYGFVSACKHMLRGEVPPDASSSAVFLVGIRDFTVEELWRIQSPGKFSDIHIQVRLIRELGPVSLVEGIVRTPAAEQLAKATLKLFSGTP